MRPILTAPLISIGIPAYKRVRYLPETLESILSQDYPNFEILISDDSEDVDVRRIADSYQSERIRYQENRPPLGIVPKLNELVQKARGDWMLILCDDDALEPGYLSALAKLAASNDRASLIYTRFKLVDAEGRLMREDAVTETEFTPYEFASRVFDLDNPIFSMNISGIAFRPKQFAELGGFKDYHKSFHSDSFAWFQLAAAGGALCDPRALCRIRLHHGSITQTMDDDFEALFETELRMQSDVPLILDELESKAQTTEERALVAKTRRVFKKHFSRWLPPFDAAFEKALQTRLIPWGEFFRVFGIMQKLNVPFYRRVYYYLALSLLPVGIRKNKLQSFTRYRQEKIQEHEEKYGMGV